MTFDLDSALSLAETHADDAEWIGIREVREQTETLSLRDGKPDSNAVQFDHGIMLEVLCDGHLGYAATNRLNDDGVIAALSAAQRQASTGARFAAHQFDTGVRPASRGEYASPVNYPLDHLSLSDKFDLLTESSAALKVSDRIVQTVATLQSVESEQSAVSTSGARWHQRFQILHSDFSATAADADETQTRSNNGAMAHSYQDAGLLCDRDALIDRLAQIGAEAVELLSADDCPIESTTLVLAPDQMMLQIHESIGHPLEIDRILGDERNYAGASFITPADFGRLQYGSPLMNVTFDPSVQHELASYRFDDTGAQAKREYLIKGGTLLRGLGSLESQARTGLPGVANARSCSWNRPPIDRMANLNLEAGDSSFNDIISAIDSGIYMQSNRSWSIDDYRNKFQFGCEYGKRIRNGRLAETIKNPNYRGVTNAFWRSLIMVGDDSTYRVYGTPYCGKGEPNQAIRVGHAAPVCAFENIEVFGAGPSAAA